MLDGEYDVVVAEGFKRTEIPTILVGDIEAAAVEGAVLDRVLEPSTVDITPLVREILERDS
ncbi:MAG: hypothetical protein ABEJ55_04430 [Halanaeroarchaeum sp.]